MAIDNLTATESRLWRTDTPHVFSSRPFENRVSKWYEFNKQIIDFLFAFVLFIIAAPVIAAAGLLVKLTSRGPMFYWQTRIGRFGRPYTIFKLRSMRHECESLTGPQWSVPGDSRITFIGRILRKTHIDELPQLWNVLRGDMSLVGPRPERPEFIPNLNRKIPYYGQRLNVKPGITGLAQVQLPPDTDLDSVRRKLAYDLYYVNHLNLWLDIRLMFCTGLQFLAIPSSFTKSLLCVPSGEKVEKPYTEATAKTTGKTKLQPA